MNKSELLKKINKNDVLIYVTKNLNHDGIFKKESNFNNLENMFFNTLEDFFTVTNSTPGIFKMFFIDINKHDINNDITSYKPQKELLKQKEYNCLISYVKSDIKVNKDESYILAIDNTNIDDLEKSIEIIDRDFVIDKMLESFSYLNDIDMLMSLDEKEEKAIEDFIDRYNIKFIGSGSSRSVYSFLDSVVKLPDSQSGEIQNKTELDVFKEESFNSDLLNPTYSIDILDLVIQPKLELITNRIEDTILEYVNNEKDKYSKSFISDLESKINILSYKHDLLIEDIEKLNSWGFDENNNLKIFDYGITNDVFEEFYF